ncbi:MAG: FkbM family methyltransferase [bacterium]|nr:FkbM family methyltransferase [bacterium]MDO8742380.1 FkbM family methyltransferase [bacterium]
MKNALKELFRKVFELTGYTPVATKLFYDPQRKRPITREDFFNLYFANVDPRRFFFVQLGANDGKTGDPLYPYVTKYRLRGIAVEPQPRAFAALVKNYQDFPEVKCLQTAIGTTGEPLIFYSVKEEHHLPDRPTLMSNIASFDKKHFLRGLVKKIPKDADPSIYTEETVISAPTFDRFAEVERIEHINFLQLDCEGMDWPILRTIDLAKYRPDIINFESITLLPKDRADAETFLSQHGYQFFRCGIDTCAYRV